MGSFRKSVRRSGVFFNERNEEVGHYGQTLINLDKVNAKLVPYLATSTTLKQELGGLIGRIKSIALRVLFE